VKSQTAKICTSEIAMGSLVIMAIPGVHISAFLLFSILQLHCALYAVQSAFLAAAGLLDGLFSELVSIVNSCVVYDWKVCNMTNGKVHLDNL